MSLQRKALGEVVDPVIEQTGPASAEFTYVDIGSIDRETKRIVEPKVLPKSKAPSRAKQRLQVGDVLVSMTRPNLNAVALIPPEYDGAIGSTGFHVLRARDALPGYLFYTVQTPDFVDAMSRKVQGALYPAVRPRDISSYTIGVPDKTEQRRIVAEIEKQFTRLDSGVAALRRVQANLKRYRAAVLKAACEGRLVPTEAELSRKEDRSFETGEELLQRILADRRKNWNGRYKYKEPTAPEPPSGVELPNGWTWAGFDQLAEGTKHAIKAGPFGSALKKSFYTPSGFKVYGQEQVIKGNAYFGDYFISHERFEELKSCAVKPGDILVSLVGTTGKVLILPDDCAAGIINPRLLKLSLNRANISARYIKVLLESSQTRAFFKLAAHGGTMEILNLGILKSLPIALPPLAEQKRIVAEVDRRLSVIDKLETVVTANLARATLLRQSILQKAFSAS